MQFHLNGFRAGDPHVVEAAVERDRLGSGQVDVLIVGCGPAGLTLAAQLAVFPRINTRIVEQKSGPLQLGQADGVACRTMEMFQAFGFAERVQKEAYWVNETTFWKPDDAHPQSISRSGRIQDVEDGLSEFPHVILNQARVHDFYLEVMRNSTRRLEPDYCRRLVDLSVDPDAEYPVSVVLERLDAEPSGESEIVQARYVVGCDGARSTVRKSIGRALRGDSANKAWGVMDVLAVTDFPDIRFKAVIRSADEGNMLIIPREGGYLVRLYVEMDELYAHERVANRNLGIEHLIAAAQRILRPYTIDVQEVVWWSVYEIGQRLCDKFDDVEQDEMKTRIPRIFITGDACHTHSPKAGQGMNVSMGDSFNLGWKLASVLNGRASPQLLHTYSAERQTVANELIDFDRHWSKRFSEAPKTAAGGEGEALDPVEFQDYFSKHGRYTAGTAVRYFASVIVAEPKYQQLAQDLTIGMRFHSAPVIRLADAKPMHLGHTVEADGRWRIFAFAGQEHPADPASKIGALCAFLDSSPDSPMRKHTPKREDIDAVIDLRAIFQQGHRELAIETMPAFLMPQKGRYGLQDREKMFCPDLKSGNDIFVMRGIDRDGCMVIVRPDQYVGHVLPLDAHGELSEFFGGFMRIVA